MLQVLSIYFKINLNININSQDKLINIQCFTFLKIYLKEKEEGEAWRKGEERERGNYQFVVPLIYAFIG